MSFNIRERVTPYNKYINKRPKGPHNVHLSTMCNLFDGLARAANFEYLSTRKT